MNREGSACWYAMTSAGTTLGTGMASGVANEVEVVSVGFSWGGAPAK